MTTWTPYVAVIILFTSCSDIQSYGARPLTVLVAILLARRQDKRWLFSHHKQTRRVNLRCASLLSKEEVLNYYLGCFTLRSLWHDVIFQRRWHRMLQCFLFGSPCIRSKAGVLKFVIETLRIVFTFKVDHDLPLNISSYSCPIWQLKEDYQIHRESASCGKYEAWRRTEMLFNFLFPSVSYGFSSLFVLQDRKEELMVKEKRGRYRRSGKQKREKELCWKKGRVFKGRDVYFC